MVHSVFKSLLLYFALFASTLVFAAPAHQHQTEHTVEPIVRRVSPRDSLRPPYPLAAELNAPIPAAIGKRSQKYGGGPKKVTNAMRFAHGLPPLAPRKLYKGSRAGSALKARASILPPMTVSAILVYGPNGRSGNPLGYVSQGFSTSYGRHYFTTDCKQAMVNAQVYLGDLTNPAQPGGFPNVGLFPGNNVASFSAASPLLGYMVGMAPTPNGPAIKNKSHYLQNNVDWYTESKVWSVGADNELLLTWINPNGAAVPMEITAHTLAGNSMAATPSLSAYRRINGYNENNLPTLRLFIADRFTCP